MLAFNENEQEILIKDLYEKLSNCHLNTVFMQARLYESW